MNIRKIGLGMALLGALCACEKDEEPIVFSAKLEVHEPLTVGRTFATLNGSVTLDGSATVKEVGFVYWEAGSPEEKTTVEGDTLALSEVTVQLEGLRMETEYEYQLFVGNGQSQKKVAYLVSRQPAQVFPCCRKSLMIRQRGSFPH